MNNYVGDTEMTNFFCQNFNQLDRKVGAASDLNSYNFAIVKATVYELSGLVTVSHFHLGQ
jgi:hypothetical protein